MAKKQIQINKFETQFKLYEQANDLHENKNLLIRGVSAKTETSSFWPVHIQCFQLFCSSFVCKSGLNGPQC